MKSVFVSSVTIWHNLFALVCVGTFLATIRYDRHDCHVIPPCIAIEQSHQLIENEISFSSKLNRLDETCY